MLLLSGEYLANHHLSDLLNKPNDSRKQDLCSRMDILYKTSEELADKCAYLKAFAHSPLSENESLLEILNKEKIYQYHHNESNVVKKLIKKSTQHGQLIAKLLQSVPTKSTYKSLLNLTDDDINYTPTMQQSPSMNPIPAQHRGTRAAILHKEGPGLSSHQTKIATFLIRIRGLLVITERVYQNWGWQESLYARQDEFIENHMIRQIFLLSLCHKYLPHELVFFNHPTLFLCFQKLCDLLAQLAEILAATARHHEEAEGGLAALGLAMSQIKYVASKLISVQYSTPGLFELL